MDRRKVKKTKVCGRALDVEAGRCEEMREIFDHYDRNQSGSIDASELRVLVESLGGKVTDEELCTGLQIVDRNKNGKISFKEFVQWWDNR